ncbi:hypothetical protein MBH78_15670 [Oceanimonas sp. NS1]|nr:hypothetical protein [Oceanimonas sp. NS1]
MGYLDYLTGVQKLGEHGQAFGYKTVNSDALGWVISRDRHLGGRVAVGKSGGASAWSRAPITRWTSWAFPLPAAG